MRKPIKDYPHYEIDNMGQVFSCYKRVSLHDRFGRFLGTKRIAQLPWVKISGSSDDVGRLRIGLHKDGAVKYQKIHSLVLETFVGPRPLGMVSRHLNGNPKDNRLENLVYGTQKENMQDRKLHGTYLSGERCTQAKLKNSDIPLIWELLNNSNMTPRRIGELFGVNDYIIRSIKNGHTYTKILT